MKLGGTRLAVLGLLALQLCCAGGAARAQSIAVGSLPQIGGEVEERWRLSQIADTNSSSNFMTRSASAMLMRQRAAERSRVMILAPELLVVANSAIPYSLNDGPMWAGRGTNALYTFGVSAEYRWVHIVLAPQFTTSQNLEFQVIPARQDDVNPRSVWANPFHPAESSIDYPLRFGDSKIRRWDAGQSSVTFALSGVALSVGSENLWWGPGTRNAMLLSNNAPGFPHALLRTNNGVTTPVGRFDGQLILGTLRESDYFDSDPSNNVRSLSAFLLEWTPHPTGGVHVGIARAVFAPTTDGQLEFSRLFDAFGNVGNPNTSAKDIARGPGPDAITSVFGRWVIPKAHFETYLEWARFEQPKSLRDLLEFPTHSSAYIGGLHWAKPLSRSRILRLTAELTYLEPDASIRVRPVATTYTSRSVVQGYTNRGQPLGAAIGPGSSSQYVSADLFGTAYRLGAFTSRIRWDNGALYDPIVPQVKAEDVSVLGGLRASATWKRMQAGFEYSHAVRLDYLFQDRVPDLSTGLHAGVDIPNRTLTFKLSTFVGR